MLRVMPKSALLNYVILIITHLKWAWDFILYRSFFQPRRIEIREFVDNGLGITQYHRKNLQESEEESAECAVCLCRIDEGDEVRELRCDHLFHKVCLDRWLGYGHVTCPLCRSNLKPPQFTAEELLQELVFVNFSAARSTDDRQMWWLR